MNVSRRGELNPHGDTSRWCVGKRYRLETLFLFAHVEPAFKTLWARCELDFDAVGAIHA